MVILKLSTQVGKNKVMKPNEKEIKADKFVYFGSVCRIMVRYSMRYKVIGRDSTLYNLS